MPSSYLLLNGLRTHYLHWEADDSARPAVLLHGLASNARIWELVAPRLVERGLRPLAPDGRGHGLTDKPDGDYGFETFRRDTLAFIDACNLERPILVGHSWGASLAVDYAAQFPVGPRAPAGILLVDGGVIQHDRVPGATWEAMRERLTPPRLAGTPLEEFLARIAPFTAGLSPDGAPPDAVESIILANFEIAQDETIWPRLTFERHMQIVRALWEFQAYARLGKVRCPAWAALAQEPAPRSPGNERFLELKRWGVEQARGALPGLQVRWFEDTYHDIPLHRPAGLADLIAEFSAEVIRELR
jgi:pimeloyl-ACP methyl ester carboxylesterase